MIVNFETAPTYCLLKIYVEYLLKETNWTCKNIVAPYLLILFTRII